MYFSPFCPVAAHMAELNPEGEWMAVYAELNRFGRELYFAYYFYKFLFLFWCYKGIDIENRRS